MSDSPYLRAVVRRYGVATESVTLDQYTLHMNNGCYVRMKYSSINPSEIITISGAYSSRFNLPFVPGFEGVGVVEGAGEYSDVSLHQRVLPVRGAGAWQEMRMVDPKWCFPIPDWLSDEQAATSYVNPMTAWLMLTDTLCLEPGSTIMINAANSSVGLMILCIARYLGLNVIAIVRSNDAANVINECGLSVKVYVDNTGTYPHVLSYGQGVDAVLDCVGGVGALSLLAALKPGGQYISYGLLSGVAIPDMFWMMKPDIQFYYFHLRRWIFASSHELISRTLGEVFMLIKLGIISTRVNKVFELSDISTALHCSQQVGLSGKILIKCS